MSSSPTALITGAAGQDGYYLSQLLLEQGYRVLALDRPGKIGQFPVGEKGLSASAFAANFQPVPYDLSNLAGLPDLLESTAPDEVYHLAALSSVGGSWADPVGYVQVNAALVAALLEALRRVRPQARFYQASSSELFGAPNHFPQNEATSFDPRSPYASAKACAHYLVKSYREGYGMYAVSGILFNHESPRRDLLYVTRKVTHAAARISLGLQERLGLGNLSNLRDWGYAGDYVRAMWLMLQQDTPEDYVIGTGKLHTVADLCDLAFGCLGLDYRAYVYTDPQFYRPLEPGLIVADSSKAHRQLGWQPQVSFEALIQMMVEHDLETLKQST